MSKHDVLEGEGELEATWDLNERGAQPAGGSLARVGPSGTSGKPSIEKNLFCEKVSQTGGGHLVFIPLFFSKTLKGESGEKNRLS